MKRICHVRSILSKVRQIHVLCKLSLIEWSISLKKPFHAALSTLEFQCPNVILDINIPIFSRKKIFKGFKIFIRKFYDCEEWKTLMVYYKPER